MTAAGGAAEDGPGAPPATTHGPAVEVLYERAECDVDMGNAAEASEATAATAAVVRPLRPVNWDTMTRSQRPARREATSKIPVRRDKKLGSGSFAICPFSSSSESGLRSSIFPAFLITSVCDDDR